MMDKGCVLCEVETEFFYIIQIKIIIYRVIASRQKNFYKVLINTICAIRSVHIIIVLGGGGG
jgi:hypothetical protein